MVPMYSGGYTVGSIWLWCQCTVVATLLALFGYGAIDCGGYTVGSLWLWCHCTVVATLLAVFGYGANVLWWLHCCEPLTKPEEKEIKKDWLSKFSVIQLFCNMRVSWQEIAI
jgi:hypothetical protein